MAFDSMALETHETPCVSQVPAHLLRLGANPLLDPYIQDSISRGGVIEMVRGGDIPSMPQLAVGTIFPPAVIGLAASGAGGWRIQYFGGEDAQMLLGSAPV